MRVAQPIAAWLVARPLHTVLGLGLTLLGPAAPILSGAVMTIAVLHQGWRRSMLMGGIAAGGVAALALVTGASSAVILLSALAIWLPTVLVALSLRKTRSLTLTMQVTAIIAIVGILAIRVAYGDVTEFGRIVLNFWVDSFRENAFHQGADFLIEHQESIAPKVVAVFVLVTWSAIAMALIVGYGLFQTLPENQGRFGRFRDLDFGRVLALVMAAASLLALPIEADWVHDLAFVAFTIFWMQGLSVLHWLHADAALPNAVLFVVYAALLIFNALPIVGLAVLGYTDAWFDFRTRMKGRSARQ